jgi:hypothetical protein
MKPINSREEALIKIREYYHSYNQETEKCNKCNLGIIIRQDFHICQPALFSITVDIDLPVKYDSHIIYFGAKDFSWFICEKMKILL